MRYATPAQYELEGRGESSAVIVAMGLALAVAGIVESLTGPVSQPIVAFELFVSLLVPTGLATGGYWLASRNVSPDRRWRAATRVSIGIVVACGLAVWLTVYVALEGGTIHDPLSLTTTLAAVGGATGFVTAVREPSTVSPAEPATSTEDRGESPTAIDPSERTERATATAETASVPTMERPTAAAATVTVSTPTATGGETAPADAPAAVPEPTDGAATADVPAVPDSPSIPEATTSRTGTGPAIWRNTDPEGRTAAPASPAEPVPTSDPDSNPRDEYDDFGDFDESGRAVESPVPMREPGVETVADVPTTAEAVLEVLRSERSRIALAVLYHEWDGAERSVDALARAVSYHAEGDVESIEIGLKHATLPELAELRAVEWDRHADRVAAAEHAVFEEGVREASVLLESFEPGTR